MMSSIQDVTAASHGARSVSVSGRPARILATLAAGGTSHRRRTSSQAAQPPVGRRSSCRYRRRLPGPRSSQASLTCEALRGYLSRRDQRHADGQHCWTHGRGRRQRRRQRYSRQRAMSPEGRSMREPSGRPATWRKSRPSPALVGLVERGVSTPTVLGVADRPAGTCSSSGTTRRPPSSSTSRTRPARPRAGCSECSVTSTATSTIPPRMRYMSTAMGAGPSSPAPTSSRLPASFGRIAEGIRCGGPWGHGRAVGDGGEAVRYRPVSAP